MDSIERVATTATNPAETTSRVTLTELNNEPVFLVRGLSNKKFFGVIPLSFAKVSFVSAQTGQIVRTDEAFFTKLLESLSI